jgi:hypothetical protein
VTARKIDIERKAWNRRGHWFALYFALSLPAGLYAEHVQMCAWAGVCLGIAIFCWYKGTQ